MAELVGFFYASLKRDNHRRIKKSLFILLLIILINSAIPTNADTKPHDRMMQSPTEKDLRVGV